MNEPPLGFEYSTNSILFVNSFLTFTSLYLDKNKKKSLTSFGNKRGVHHLTTCRTTESG